MKLDHRQFRAASAYGARDGAEDRIRRFLPMVHRAAWHINGSGRAGLEIDDLVQAGMVALTECARRHDGPTEDGFAAYARIRVRGAMFDAIRRTLPDSRGAVRRRRQREEMRQKLTGELGREPDRAELNAALDHMPGGHGADEMPVRLTSLDADYDDGDGRFADDTPDAFDLLSGAQDRSALIVAITQLPERQQLVLQLYFTEELNLTEIAAVLEVSVPRVHQIKAAALKSLRSLLEQDEAA
ncbi:sigma-70 family RNA polymerase sigma factor [Croceicoccus sp. YJ47]|uniref:sigma-70 family RNA polymerase sigma factor n=1 Tax=Croceicoccus sp. YJ47 TaxID=2798724 RepID=UPI001924C3CE|nr:sigma-70 family RNA polymerase sigma factor [Croceicoccus sp. YJ47]QQN75565.1 sigma-70 family RNA polymerase sigma factor [Croceicoccus sp. YJ47]